MRAGSLSNNSNNSNDSSTSDNSNTTTNNNNNDYTRLRRIHKRLQRATVEREAHTASVSRSLFLRVSVSPCLRVCA